MIKGSQLRLQRRVDPVKYMHLYFINICVSSNKKLENYYIVRPRKFFKWERNPELGKLGSLTCLALRENTHLF